MTFALSEDKSSVPLTFTEQYNFTTKAAQNVDLANLENITVARIKPSYFKFGFAMNHVTHFFLSHAHAATPIPKIPKRSPTLSSLLKLTLYHFISLLKKRLCRWLIWSSPRPDAFLKCVTLPLWEHENGASSIVGSPYPARNHGSRCLPSRPSLPPVDRRL